MTLHAALTQQRGIFPRTELAYVSRPTTESVVISLLDSGFAKPFLTLLVIATALDSGNVRCLVHRVVDGLCETFTTRTT